MTAADRSHSSASQFRVTLTAISIFLFLLFSIFAVLEYSRSRNDLIAMLREEGMLALEMIRASGERNILAYEALEAGMQQRLLSASRMIEAMDYSRPLDAAALSWLVQQADLHRIHLLNDEGRLVATSHVVEGEVQSPDSMIAQAGIADFIQENRGDSLVVGLQVTEDRPLPRYAVVWRRRRGGGVVVAADAARLLALRRDLGPGRLIQEIGERPGVSYVVLQDTLGLLLASRGVSVLNRLNSDAFLSGINERQSEGTRFFDYHGARVFETAGSFVVEGENLGLLRIGLEARLFHHVLSNVRGRLGLLVLIFIATGVAGIGFWTARANARAATASFLRVKTHTGEILQRMNEAVIVIDGAEVITIFNQAAETLLKRPQDKVVGRLLADLQLPVEPIFRETLDSGQARQRIRETVKVGRERRILSLRTSVVSHKAGQIDSVILVATDLTDQAALENELRQKEKMSAMGTLASGVAHEIRNPINAIGLIAQRFLKEFRPVSEIEEYETLARTMVQETRRSSAIIQRFLEYARPPELNRLDVSMPELLKAAVDVMKSQAQRQSTELILSGADESLMQIDGDQMKQALINILGNGLQAVGSGGRIIVSGIRLADAYRIEIADSGPGIDESIRDRVFDLYFTTKSDGLGMGLAMVHQIVQRHGGSIKAKSPESGGSIFIILLPGDSQ